MKFGLIGVGRMGKVLASRLSAHADVLIYDRDGVKLNEVADELGLMAANDLAEIASLGTVVLVVPDREVISCIKDFNLLKRPLHVINVATNVAQHVLEETAAKHVRCIGVKFVAHAREMALGSEPVIIVNEWPVELTMLAAEIFAPVGKIIIGQADQVSLINTKAVEMALTAAVEIEEALTKEHYYDPDIIKSAIRQVAAGALKGYADGDLGPFAREIVQAIRAKMKR
ncbi:MAG TPA: NAD(P)-binding domain-containing protein [Methylomusa anaerophila]|uniref:NADP oxidoreductase coenzyme F420-dependent n=1 Tax=Methylomusa anaerophila TaxID=1930071 RepID=A0A348AIG8_9FIRM|nr:NAD(P)-binding domain-containing protein [Methylomusa anaerophila]BBB90866.1 NADP oxidoreductase coenzyme F420-dependent [Methylomusa anaerophila]HML90659.1 NAD(P)-binding domain-containing protein [Methylomusa anaerophila]